MQNDGCRDALGVPLFEWMHLTLLLAGDAAFSIVNGASIHMNQEIAL